MSGPFYDPRFPGGQVALDVLTTDQQEILRAALAQPQLGSIPQPPQMSPFGASLISPPPTVAPPPPPPQSAPPLAGPLGGFGVDTGWASDRAGRWGGAGCGAPRPPPVGAA